MRKENLMDSQEGEGLMAEKREGRRILGMSVLCSVVGAAALIANAAQTDPGIAAQKEAKELLAAAGVQGGFVVHVGCGDGRLTAALHADAGFLVQGWNRNADHFAKARQFLQSHHLYGPVTTEMLPGNTLPYVDNLVNLLVVEDPGRLTLQEFLRVLAPEGVALIADVKNRKLGIGVKNAGGQSVRIGGRTWLKIVKPRPQKIDEWTHFLYDATNNAVSDDSVVGPPRQLQWVGGPSWTRSHDHLASVSAVVSSNGRLFSIVDEAPIATILLEPQWRLVARDAFSGVVLWKRPIPDWQWHLRGFRTGPSDLSRRLVAVGDRVYVTLGLDVPVSILDAATGHTLRTCAETDGALEIVYDHGTVFVVAGNTAAAQAAKTAERRGQHPGFVEVRPQRPAYLEDRPLKRLVALDAATGRVLWTKSDNETAELMPTTLAVSDGRVFFQNADDLICLDAHSGKTVWQADRPASRSRPSWSGPTLVVYGDVVLSGDRAVAEKKVVAPERNDQAIEWIVSSAGGIAPVGELIAFSVETGERLWSTKCRECYNAPVDVLVAGGLVWTGNIVRASDPGVTEGRDPKTGEVKRTRPKDQTFFSPGMGHQRCYRNKATNRYLVFGRSGVEFIDLTTGKPIPNHWTRGTCQYGVMPCNGLLYVPPHSCACFIRSKLNGFNCFAPERRTTATSDTADVVQKRLVRGPAYDQNVDGSPSTVDPSLDWPTYRHDAARSGSISGSVAPQLRRVWNRQLGGRLSSVVVAEGKLFVAQVDQHTIHALDAKTGQTIWSYITGGRVDSPPTVWQGRVLFGSADGSVYCLNAQNGDLAWRFRAAPSDQRIVAYGQVESCWPVSGSVLVRDGIAYCAAGRSSYLDGGIRLCRLDAKTGQLLSETRVDDRDPETGYQRKEAVRGTNMPGALPDILSCDGNSIYMRHRRFDLTGQPQDPDVSHLFSAAGFLDDTWWHRTYWMFGTIMGTNYGGWPNSGMRVPAGRLLVLDDSGIYGFGRSQYIHHGAHVGLDGATVFHFRPDRDSQRRFTYYQAFAIDRKASIDKKSPSKAPAKRRGKSSTPPKQYRWTEKLPVLARALVLAHDSLFLAGPPDIFSSDDPAAAWSGTKGGLLYAVSTRDGSQLAQYELDSPPVFDGLIAARGRLYLSTVSGDVVCFGSRQ